MATNKTFLPDRNSSEGQGVEKLYPTASLLQIEKWAMRYGYKNPTSFENAVRKGWRLERAKLNRIGTNDNYEPEFKPEPEAKYLPYPEIKLKPFKIPKSKRDEEDICFVIADPHLCKITPSYSPAIARARFDYLLDSAETIINLHRPIRKAHIFFVGDVIQGENAFQGSKVGETEYGAYEQIHETAVPLISKFCLSLAQGIATIDIYGVRGNHGRYAREAPAKTNWDTFFYKSLSEAVVNQKTINVYPAKDFYQLINIRGFRFFLIHGDQARGNAGIPVIALRRKMQEWYAYVGRFNYAYAGHFHTGYYDHINTEADYTISPPLVTGDEWAVEMIGRASVPTQLCFGVHDKYGRTFKYDLHTDEKFLPSKFDEPEGEVKV